MVYPGATSYTPLRLRLNPGLDSGVEVRLDFPGAGQSGILHMWNTPLSDPARSDAHVPDGGNRLIPGNVYTLEQLNYNPGNGAFTIFIEAILVFPNHDTKKDVDDNGKPDDRIRATLVSSGTDLAFDEVKYMVVTPGTFYPHLSRFDNKGEQIRSSLASDVIYPYRDASEFTLKKLDSDDLVDLGVPNEVRIMLIDNSSPLGFKAAIYREHVTGLYILTFAGTDDATEPSLVDASEQDASKRVDLIKKTIRIAERFASATVVFSSGRPYANEHVEGVLERLASRVDLLIQETRESSVSIAIRPLHSHVISSIANFERLRQWLRQPESLGLVADVNTMSHNGELPAIPILHRHIDNLGGVFLSDGDGIDREAIATGLAEFGFAGPLILSGHQLSEDPVSLAISEFGLFK